MCNRVLLSRIFFVLPSVTSQHVCATVKTIQQSGNAKFLILNFLLLRGVFYAAFTSP